ncbi:Catenin alpha-2 [Liparis tanakae]|uniref:Catenin alpha-2 n=1 Tax=Liparis tanakae TaxID=230148 RepID=A0A4Z2H7J2_9TELE|nr:Catenin alpha-2 [Liparis tanakae]
MTMSSVFDHGLIRTAAVEQAVAPMASHLCLLVLLCDSAEEAGQMSRLEAAAQAVAKATGNMAAVASRQIRNTEDDILHVEMSSLLESVTVSGQHVLLAAQKLSIQPGVTEHREELIAAAQNVFLGVAKVLLVDDDATVRSVVAAAERVLQSLSELGSASDVKSLLRSFRLFSEALIFLNNLTVERANALQDPGQEKQLLDSLDTLRRCISMLHTAMCTTIRHPTSAQARQAKRYILDKLQGTVRGVIVTLKSRRRSGSPGPCGYFTGRRNSLLQLLADSPASSTRGGGFDSAVRDLVFHCMVVANSSRREFQQTVVGHCRHVLQFWSDMKTILTSTEGDSERLQSTCTLLVQQIQTLDKALMTSVLYQVLDTFRTASATVEELLSVTRRILVAGSSTEMDLSFIQPQVEDFISYTDRIIKVASFLSAFAVDAKSLESVENSRVCLARTRARLASLSLELADNSLQTVEKIHEACARWEEEETSQLRDALGDVMDVREFTSIAIDELVDDQRGCDSAYREQSYHLFREHAANLTCHMKLAVHSVRGHLDRSDDPIHRNGLLVLLKQVQSSRTKVSESVRDMLLGTSLNVEVYSTFSDRVSVAIQHFKVLRNGLDGQQHPRLMSPLREEARRPEISQPCAPVKDACDLTLDHKMRACPVSEVTERDSQAEHEEEHSREEREEDELAHKHDFDDLRIAAVAVEPKMIRQPLEFDLLPLLYEVVTVTKGKDVTALNRACAGVFELSNCYAQAAKEAAAVVDAADCQTLERSRAELVSLTPLLVQTAQETAMSSSMSTESLYKHSAQFSDLINNTRKVLLPVAGSWYHAVYTELRGNLPTTAAFVTQRLHKVMTLCAEAVRLLTSSDLTSQSDGQETFSVLHNKLNKAQNNTKHLVEWSGSSEGQLDQLEGLCILWGLSIQVLLNSLDKILGTSTAMNQLSPQKQISVLAESSLRIQEAAGITSLNCRSAYKSKQLAGYQDELKALTEAYLKAAEELDIIPSVMQLAKSDFIQRHLLIQMRVLSSHLSKANTDYDAALRNIVRIAHLAVSSKADVEQTFDSAAQALFENVQTASKRVEECLHFIRDPHTRSNLRSINDLLSFQISDIISRARLVVETRCICDTLGLDVQVQCWSAKAHYVVEELGKQDGIHREAKENIKAGLQGRTHVKEVLAAVPTKVKEAELSSDMTTGSRQRGNTHSRYAAEAKINFAIGAKCGLGNIEKVGIS